MKRNLQKSLARPLPRERVRAEARARLVGRAPAHVPADSAEKLLHELQIHQMELEMQNEQLRADQLALEEARDRYIDLYEFAPVGYATLTAEGQIADINFAGARLLGLEREHLKLRRFDDFVAPSDLERWRRLFIDLKTCDEPHVEELGLKCQDGAVFPAQLDCRRKRFPGVQLPTVRMVLIDLSATKLAFYDPLTNLPNRRLMADRLHHAMAGIARSQKYCGLLFLDLDKFKTLNDTLGHDVGDQLLVQVAQRLAHGLREGDTVARLGGDEFVVLLENLSECPNESANQARAIGEKIAQALDRPYRLAGQECRSSASIGAVVFNDPRERAEELLKRADMAMYEAKAAGRNALRFFDRAMQEVVTARAALEADMRGALAGRQLQCHYQLQIDDAGSIRGAEVLLRWQHPARGLMAPAAFIRVAEQSGLAVAIGQWVLETACARLQAWQARLPERRLRLAVNIGARQFHGPNFVEQVRAALDASGIDPGCLTLEFKEKLAIADLDDGGARMAALKKLGVRLAIDDFGMGSSSCSQLSRLPLDQLKIDRSLVRGIGVTPSDNAIAQTLIAATRHLGMELVAEGVETEAQRAFLERHGCRAFQGYLFGRPVPGQEFEQLLTRH
ncbi:MAG: EAL domain-containing protein [Rhodocyclaceae bacterium]|nr:EAL domain-containing protein [Rhodocyclaceae bacterium]